MEEEEKYHAYLTSPFYQAWFQEYDPGNYKEIAQRARFAGATFLFLIVLLAQGYKPSERENAEEKT